MKKYCFFFLVIALCSSANAQTTAKDSDIVDAAMFISSLPRSCWSRVETRNDGSVVVPYSCPENGGTVQGMMYIKDGKKTKLGPSGLSIGK